jgi:uncharacterized protein YjbI with pentapeptide repeats/beta-lactamase regulating signal transducer with metallopeptidase domain
MGDWHQIFVTLASAITAIALNALWQDAFLVLCVWLLLRAWPRVNAATRYVVWTATLFAAFIVPVATTLAFFAPAKSVTPASTTTPMVVANTHPVTSVPQTHRPKSKDSATSSAASGSVARESAPASVARLPERLRLTMPMPAVFAIFALWLVLAAYALVRLAIGLVRLEQLKRDALPLPVEYRDAMPQWLRANKGGRDVRLCVSDETDVPVAVGLFDAMILIPHSLLERLSEPEVDQICLHELAHLRRADDWTNGLQRVVSALLGWNPAAQFIGQQLDLEREVACDDWVLSFVGTVRPYALCLTKMAESAAWPRHAIPAPGVFSTRKHISLRIERLLGAGRNIATNLSIGPAAAAIAVVGAIGLVIAFVAPSIAAPRVTPVVAARDVNAVAVAPPSPRAELALASPQPQPQVHVNVPPTQVSVPAMHVDVPAKQVNVPAVHVNVPAKHVNVPAMHVSVPATHVDVPATHVDVPATHVDVPATHVDVPATHVDVPGVHVDVPGMHLTVPGTHVALPKMHSLPGMGMAVAQARSSCSDCDYTGVNWSGRDMHGVNYSGVDFSKANLAHVNFSGGSFSGADFSSANLQGASFRNAHLSGCDFANANLSGADFTGASISHCDLTGLNLRNVNFSGAKISGADLSHATLEGANLTGATLSSCELSGVDLRNVDLSKTKISGTNFSNERDNDNSPP